VVRSSMEGEVLVLRVPIFGNATAASIAKAVADVTAQRQPQGVVLDLRGNPGGLLREAVKVADAFLKEGEIVSLRGSAPDRQRAWLADADELLTGLPMVVLIDRRSASASELVADALQHSGRAVVMGQRSFGKGSVQTIYPLGEQKGALKLTTATYYGPSGQTVQRTGVAPDVEMLGATDVASARPMSDSPQPAGEAQPQRPVKARVDPGRCKAPRVADPVLSCAVAYLAAGTLDSFLARLAD
jgi:carboxyl-terminal processing protease